MESSYWSQRRLGRRRLLGIGAGSALAAGLVACAGPSSRSSSAPAASGQSTGASGPPARQGGTLLAMINFDPPLDPQKVSAIPQRAVGGVYSRIFRFQTGPDPKTVSNRNLENDLGVSAESPDGVAWTVKLRPDATFHNVAPLNGRPAEAEDVRTTFVRAVDPATSNPNRGQLGMIDPNSIQTPDKQTVIFKLNYPYAPFNRTLVSPAYSWILPREVSTGAVDPAKQAIGTGPFMLDTATPDVAYTYKRNPNWFDKPRPYVDAIKMAVVPDSSQQQAQFTAGNLDEITVPDQVTADTMTRSNPKAALVKAVNGTPNPVFWQLGDPASAFQDIRVRRAFNMAVDRDTIAKVIFEGQAAAPVFIPPSMGKWSMLISDLPADTQQYFKYNPTEAKKMLDAAGAGNLQLQLAYPNTFGTPAYVKHCETIGNMLNAVGVKTSIVVIDYNKDYIDSGKGISQGYYDKNMIVFGGFSPYTEADEWLFSYYDSKSLNSHQHLNDPKMDAMIAQERTLLDDNQRLKAVLDIQRYIADQALFLPTVGPYYYYLVQPRVQSYQFSDTLGVHTETYSKLWLNT